MSDQVTRTDDFKERSKNVFDTLDNLESVHQNKRKNYERDEDDGSNNDLFVAGGGAAAAAVGVSDFNEQDEENSHSNSQHKILRTKNPQQADHVANPQKWKKYNLEDVEENNMTGRVNTQAAMDFLNSIKSKKQEINEGEDEEQQKPVFNKIFGARNDNDEEVTLQDDEEESEDSVIEEYNDDSVEPVSFKRKSVRGHLRQHDDDDNEGDVEDGDVLVENGGGGDDDDDNSEEEANGISKGLDKQAGEDSDNDVFPGDEEDEEEEEDVSGLAQLYQEINDEDDEDDDYNVDNEEEEDEEDANFQGIGVCDDEEEDECN
jgi:hypothetical protein